MRRGCISLGNIKCDGCHRTIPFPERFLAVDEQEGVEAEKGRTMHYCVNCCLEKGYARHRVEKGEKILTFFEEPPLEVPREQVEGNA